MPSGCGLWAIIDVLETEGEGYKLFSRLLFLQVDVPHPKGNSVRVQVKAAGLVHLDNKVTTENSQVAAKMFEQLCLSSRCHKRE